MAQVPISIITCPQWHAVLPKKDLVLCGMFHRFIFHHTAGHHREIAVPLNESREEAIRYARDIQHYHMTTNGWDDSGHNFLVCRNGLILQGRWLSVSAIQVRRMVLSAHCPGQNDQIGIEHEHLGHEKMTDAQRESSARLIAWAAHASGYKTIPPVEPHSKYFSTACPANLINEIPIIRRRAAAIMSKVR